MSRERMTQRNGSEILAEIERLERRIKAQDEDTELADEAQGLADEEVSAVSESTDTEGEKEDLLGQNDKAMDNWPLSASERRQIAQRCVRMARELLKD